MIISRLQLQPDHLLNLQKKKKPDHLLHLEMRMSSLSRLLLQKTSRAFHGNAHEASNWRAALKMELAYRVPDEDRKAACIYKVPENMRKVQPKAYAPSIISIGPYHHGEGRLREMEELKWEFFHRLFGPKRHPGVELDKVMNAVEDLEQDARKCYGDRAQLLSTNSEDSKDRFVKMMLLDGCFIAELFRELNQNKFHYARSVKRWMLPTLRRDMIMLENQLPLFVLQRLFDLTKRSGESTTESLEDLALRFFNPLLQRESDSDVRSRSSPGTKHFLDLFRLGILPRHLSEAEETGKAAKSTTEEGIDKEENDIMKSTTELMEAGVIFEKGLNVPPLDVRSDYEGRLLKIPPLYIDDYKGTLFRNLVAYEQCHPNCKPNVTSYLFFFDGLINSADDVDLLHLKGVLQHSLGNDKEVARLVNGLCKEIARDARESYLNDVVSGVYSYYSTFYAKFRAKLVHQYFSSWVVGISTLGAVIVLYLTLIQTAYGFVGEPLKHEEPFHCYLWKTLTLPVSHLFTFIIDQINSKPESEDDSLIGQPWWFTI